MLRLAVMLLLLGSACASAPLAPPVLPEDAAGLGSEDMLQVLLAIDRIEDRRDAAAGPWLLVTQTNPGRPIEVRTRASAALVGLGFRSGEGFCLAVLGANLAPFAQRDLQHELPRSDRWAFPRELAVRALAARFEAADRTVPDYDVNYGAPDLARATRAFEVGLSELPPARPSASRAELAARIPVGAPADFDPARWASAREQCLLEARP